MCVPCACLRRAGVARRAPPAALHAASARLMGDIVRCCLLAADVPVPVFTAFRFALHSRARVGLAVAVLRRALGAPCARLRF